MPQTHNGVDLTRTCERAPEERAAAATAAAPTPDGEDAARLPAAAPPAAPVLAVAHGWLGHAALGQARALLVRCLLPPGGLGPPKKMLDPPAGGQQGAVQVEWAGSGIVLSRHLPLPVAASPSGRDDVPVVVVELQKAAAGLLDAHSPQSEASLWQDVRLFAGHGGPELTWPDLAWFPDERASSPPDEAVAALQLLRQDGTHLIATRGDFGKRMLEARVATPKCKLELARASSLPTNMCAWWRAWPPLNIFVV
jgi:hypothetical protein